MPRPFDTGSQYGDWDQRNCEECWKVKRCAIVRATSGAYLGDGQVSDDIARRMGWTGPGDRYTWDCPERESRRPPSRVRQHRTRPGQLALLEVVNA